MRKVIPWALVLACGAPAEPNTSAKAPPPPVVPETAAQDEELLMHAAANRGVLDGSGELRN